MFSFVVGAITNFFCDDEDDEDDDDDDDDDAVCVSAERHWPRTHRRRVDAGCQRDERQRVRQVRRRHAHSGRDNTVRCRPRAFLRAAVVFVVVSRSKHARYRCKTVRTIETILK